jgi:Tfp pilus assembly ATPase PilU
MMIPEKAKTKQFPTVDILYRPKGCVHCNFTGYYGRKGIFEVLPVTQEIRDLIDSIATEKEIFDAAVKDGMATMAQDGLIKVLEGITTMDEVWAASGREDSLRDLYEAFDDITLDGDATEAELDAPETATPPENTPGKTIAV